MSEQKEKAIFRYWDGVAHVWGDPLAINRKLVHACGCDPNTVLAAANGKPQKDEPADPLPQNQAKEILVQAVRYAFEMQPFDKQQGQGATDDECFAALNAYSEFMEKKNPIAASSPTWSPSTAPEYSQGPSTTPIGSAYGQTWTGSEP